MSRIEALIDEKYREASIPIVRGLVCEVKDSKQLGTMIVFLTENYPLPEYNLTHLKRIDSKNKNAKRIFVCPLPEDMSEDHTTRNEKDEFRTEKLKDTKLKDFLLGNDIEFLSVIDIPACMPVTRAQNVNALKLWPVNFHENKHLEKCLSGTVFSHKDTKQIEDCFQQLLSDNSSDDCCEMSALITKSNRSIVVSKTRLSQHSSDQQMNPLEHPILQAIEQVSEKHRIAKENVQNCPQEMRHFLTDYLCTNYECFLTQDPCIMCAMALVHSRIKRVFILDKQPLDCCSDKSFQTHRLHYLPNLNHHFEVFLVHLDPNVGESCVPVKRIKLTGLS